MVLLCDLLCAQVFLDGQRVIGPAFDGCVVRNNHAFDVVDATDSGNDSRRRHVVVVYAVGREPADLEKRRVVIGERVDSIAGQQFAADEMTLA